MRGETAPQDAACAIDSLFEKLNRPGHPGMAVGVYLRGELAYLRGFGLADLEHGIAITPRTVFHVASVSKQFAAFAIGLLHRDGQLDLDADIRQYLPYVPDFGQKISTRHLVHHTSGLRDQWALFELGGQGIENRLRQQQILNMVARQRALNFEPGSALVYSNTGYTLMAEIVCVISGRTLRQFTTERMFQPLGMTRTFFYDDVNEIVPDRAHSYDRHKNGGWIRKLLNFDNVGATSLHSTAEDMLKWTGNFARPKVGDAALIALVGTPGKLRDGSPTNYGFALTQREYAGHEALVHFGVDAGFRAVVAYFPGADLGIAMLSNHVPEDWSKLINGIGDVYLNGTGRDFRSYMPGPVEGDPTTVRDLVGCYVSSFDPMVTLEEQDGRLFWRSGGGEQKPVVFRDDASFDLGDTDRNGRHLIPQLDQYGRVTGLKEWNATFGQWKAYRRIEPVRPTLAELTEYAGDYRSSELDITYTLTIEQGHVTARSLWSAQPLVLVPSLRDRFDADHVAMSVLEFIRDVRGNVTSLRVHGPRARHVLFERVPAPESGSTTPQ